MGIKILPPDVNESFANFTLVGDCIRFGLAAVKNVGHGAIDSIIIARRDHKRFTSLFTFTQLVDPRLVNRKVLESLIKCGAFDSLGLFRSQLFAVLDNAIDAAGGVHKDCLTASCRSLTSSRRRILLRTHTVCAALEWPEIHFFFMRLNVWVFIKPKNPLTRFEKLNKDIFHLQFQDLAQGVTGKRSFLRQMKKSEFHGNEKNRR
jgi:DNA polymerase III alpha subunit